MSLELEDLKKLHDKAYSHNEVTRERGADDLVFYWVTQWDDNLLQDSQLSFRGEFNILRKGGRQIMSDLRTNPVQVDFDPKDSDRDDGAELLDGLYRSDDRRNTSLEAYDYASQDAVVCGYGAWELYTEYQSRIVGDEKQVIKRRYIPEANNTCFWDPNAKCLDKSDANYNSMLTAYSIDGYNELREELTGADDIVTHQSFKTPEQSYTFPWFGKNDVIYVVTFYHREKVQETIIKLTDPFGTDLHVRESELVDVEDDLIDKGYKITGERVINRMQITRYIASGIEILEEKVIAGENIPVIPCYGERAFVEDEETWEGVTRLAKDPQRLRNFQLSYLADIVSRSPRTKAIFFAEQIQGFEDMYKLSGSENNFPYLLQNRFDANGAPLPIGPVAEMPDQPIPEALAASIDLSRQAVEDVVNPGLPQDIADPDLSGKAVIALQNRLDQQSYIYQHNMKFAKRRDGEVYASMASEVFAQKREVTVTAADGKTKKIKIMDEVIDKQTGELVTINDLSNQEFDVYANIGPSYSSQKEATIDKLAEMRADLPPGDPLKTTLLMKQLVLMDGVEHEDIRDYANKQLLISGVKTPDSPEDEAIIAAAAQQRDEPTAEMVLALAEDKKGEAMLMRERREAIKTQADMINDNAETRIDAFEAETDRMNTQIDAEIAGADIRKKDAETLSTRIDNNNKAYMSLRVPVTSALLSNS